MISHTQQDADWWKTFINRRVTDSLPQATVLKYWPANNFHNEEWREQRTTSANSLFNVFKLCTNQLVN